VEAGATTFKCKAMSCANPQMITPFSGEKIGRIFAIEGGGRVAVSAI